ncbi:hypothetical protein E2C01_030534 [Portunus trituberculatus]|uniref:Uncharacterized protein n=1 Tax=Portunus trituberculatus TaxID=210409 RepID=A0A5B7ER32_PORTR|nr:hypothetical protein [Portunus trituberculatus]
MPSLVSASGVARPVPGRRWPPWPYPSRPSCTAPPLLFSPARMPPDNATLQLQIGLLMRDHSLVLSGQSLLFDVLIRASDSVVKVSTV